MPSVDARAQLQWGPGGMGGSGTWDLSTANWWNGADNVAWNGGTAVFGGTGGMVTGTSNLLATGLTFNSAGYTLQGGSIRADNGSQWAGFDFVVTTNEAATINSALDGNLGTTLVKRGSGMLTVTGTNFIDTLRIEAGEYRVAGSSSLIFSDVVLADAPGVTLTLARTSKWMTIGSLSGGGAAGGIVQPDTQARTVTMTVFDGSTFDGVLQDNGPGKLALEVFTSPDTLKLTRGNSYSGPTEVTRGTLAFSGNGAAVASSALTIEAFGVLRMDNSEMALQHRLSDVADVNLRGGRIEMIGNPTVPVQEQLGILKYAGASTLEVTQSGTAEAVLVFAGVEGKPRATLNLVGNGRVGMTGVANRSTGIAGPSITAGNEWATVGTDGRLQPFANYVNGFGGASSREHVKLTVATTALVDSTTVATLNWQNETGSPGVLDLGTGRTLTLMDGGLLSSGSSANEIHGGSIKAGGNEIIIVSRNALTIGSTLTETLAGAALVKAGAGKLTLTGANRYSGTTAINEGILEVGSDAALGTGSRLEFNGGTLRASASFSSTKVLTTGTDYPAMIDTAEFDLTFSSPQTTYLSKSGSGTLNLPNSTDPIITLNAGTLVLPVLTSGSLTLNGGTLVAAGTLDRLSLSEPSILDLGGSRAAALEIGSLSGLGYSRVSLTIRTGVGVNGDVLRLPYDVFSYVSSPASVIFDFENLGDAVPGSTYTLITSKGFLYPPSPSIFSISPADVAAGWNGTFSTDASSVKITFSSVPEPRTVFLTAIGMTAF